MKKLIIIVTTSFPLETWLQGQPKFLSGFYDVEIITASSPVLAQIEKIEGIPIKVMDFNRKINIFKDLKVLVQLSFYLLAKKPSIVYTLTPKAGLLGMIASWIARTPHRVHSVVGLPHLEAQGYKKKILIFTEKITYFFASNLYCNSIVLAETVRHMSHKKVTVIGNGSVSGINTELFKDTMEENKKIDLRKSLGFSGDDFVITYAGRIVNDKGINELINAFIALAEEEERVKLLLIGDYKNEHDSISEKSKNILNNHSAIEYLEFKEDIREYLSISDLFVLPSYREGLPNVLLEAGSYGIPLIATDINGCNEVIENGVNGLLIKKKDREELLNAMRKFTTDRVFYHSIQSHARSSIVEKYDQKYFWTELRKEFRKIESTNR